MDSIPASWRASQRALPHVASMHAYTPGTQPQGEGWIKLNTNELPYPASPAVGPAIEAEIGRLTLYPNPTSQPLRETIARLAGLDPSQVMVGNGSDDVLNLLTRAFSGRAVGAGMTFPSYSLYPVLTAIQGTRMDLLRFDRSMTLPIREIATSTANLFYLTSPNAPTGVGFGLDTVRAAASVFRGIFVVDEAYADFATENALPLLGELPNVVITRTLSKSYGLAGLRVGYALGSPEVIELLDRVRDSYNVNRLSQAGAIAALEDQSYYSGVVGKVIDTRDSFISSLRERGWFVFDSQANFVFGEPVDAQGGVGAAVARSLFDHLTSQRILVRYFPGDALTESFLRISIGTPEQMARVTESIDQWRKHA